MRRFVVVAAVVLAFSPSGAVGAGSQAKAKAKVHYDSGTTHYDLGEYPQALADYTAAYRVKADPVFLFNIAQCHRKLGHKTEALARYKSYLQRLPDAENRALVERFITELQQAIEAEKQKPPPAAPAPAVPPAEVVAPVSEAQPPPSAAPVPTAVPAPLPPPESPAPSPPPPPPPPAIEAKPNPIEPFAPPPTPPVAVPVVPPVAAATAPAPVKPAPAIATKAQPREKSRDDSRWWFWAAVGVVAIGAVAATIAATRNGSRPDCPGDVECL